MSVAKSIFGICRIDKNSVYRAICDSSIVCYIR